MPIFKKNSGGYEAKRPVMGNPEEGTSVRDLLLKASGKTAGQDLTIEDIQAVVSRSNMSERDAKRTMKGASKFLSSGYDYRSKEGGTYDVFDQGTPLSQSSRKAGDRKGKDFMGDVLKTGRNVGLVVGLAQSTQAKPNTSSSGSTGFNPDFKEPTITVPQMTASDMMKGMSQWRNGSSSGEGSTVVEEKESKTQWGKSNVPAILHPNEDNSKLNPAFGNLHGGFKLQQDGFTRKPVEQKKKGWQDYIGLDVNNIGDFILGDANPSRAIGEIMEGQVPTTLKELGTVWNPAQMWSKEARDKAVALAKSKGAPPETVGGSVPNMGIFTPTPGKFTGAVKAPEWLKNVGKNVAEKGKNAASYIGNKVGNVMNPAMNSGLPNPKMINTMSEATDMLKKVQSSPLEPAIKDKLIREISDVIKANKTRWQQIDDAASASYDMDMMRKGGVIKGGNGVKTPKKPYMMTAPVNTTSSITMDAVNPAGSTLWSPARATLAEWSAKNMGDLSSKIGPMKPVSINTASPTGGTGSPAGNYLAKFPGQNNPFADSNKALDYVGTAGKYILPFIGEGLARKAWKDVKPMKWEDAPYKTGAVRDLPQPNLNLRARNPIGPDVQSELTGQKFGDAQQRDALANYHIQNAMSKLEQENQVLARTNEGLARNKQGKLQTDMVNAQIGTQKAGAMADSYREPFIAGQQHLNQDMSSSAYLDFAKKSSLAEQILKYGNTKDPNYQYALKWINAKKGGKLKAC